MKKAQTEVKVDMLTFKDAVVLTETGQAVKLHQLWQKRTAIFVFLRHFGCTACRAHARQVWARRNDYQKNGAIIHFIGNGAPEMISSFKHELGIEEALMLTDPTLDAFKACGFRNGFLVSHGPRSLANLGKMVIAGNRQTFPSEKKGNIWQLGGVLVVHPDGFIPYHYISEATGDFPPEADVDQIGEM